jgi:hypothetical protein
MLATDISSFVFFIIDRVESSLNKPVRQCPNKTFYECTEVAYWGEGQGSKTINKSIEDL